MENIELEAQSLTRGPYDEVPQEDRGPESPQISSKLTLAETAPKQSTLKSYTRAPRSKRIQKHIAIGAAALLLASAPVALLMPGIQTTDPYSFGQDYCAFNGPGSELQPWSDSTSPSEILLSGFQIDSAYGNLTFVQAKVIDLVWDVGVSRCGQALLGWVTYQVNTAALLRIMETNPVSYDFFSTLSFSRTSLASLITVAKTFLTKLGFRKRLLILWLAMSIIWVATWPTFTNAMTGYIAKVDLLIRLKSGDGFESVEKLSLPENLGFQFCNYSFLPNRTWSCVSPIGPILNNTGPNITLWEELKNIYSQSGQFQGSVTDSDYQDATSNGTSDVEATIWHFYENESYEADYTSNPGNLQCATDGSYSWGFSSAATIYFAVLNGLWCVGTYGVWIHMNRKSELCRKGRRLGIYRAALDMAEAIHEDLGNDICAYSQEELKENLGKEKGIMYYAGHGEKDGPAHIGISSRRHLGPVKLRFGELYGSTSQS